MSLCFLLAFPAIDTEIEVFSKLQVVVLIFCSHFILCIAAIPGAQADYVKGGIRISPLPLEECSALYRAVNLERCPADMEKKSIEHNLKKICSKKRGLIG